MKTIDFIQRYSVARRDLTGECEGVSVHLCRAGGHSFGGVIDGDVAWLVKLKPIQVNGYISQTARAIYDAVAHDAREQARLGRAA